MWEDHRVNFSSDACTVFHDILLYYWFVSLVGHIPGLHLSRWRSETAADWCKQTSGGKWGRMQGNQV